MDESYFEGTLILEKLAEVGKIEAFYEAIDTDNTREAKRLMMVVGIDHETIVHVLKLIEGSHGNHQDSIRSHIKSHSFG